MERWNSHESVLHVPCQIAQLHQLRGQDLPSFQLASPPNAHGKLPNPASVAIQTSILVVDVKEAKRDVLGLVQPPTHTPEITHPYHALEDVVGSGGLDSERVRKLPNVEGLLNAGLSWAIDAQEARQGSDDRDWRKGKQRRYWKSESMDFSKSPSSEFGVGSTNRT